MNLLNVFAYGTLQEPEVLKELIGRVPEIKAAHVDGYVRFFDDDIGYFSARTEEGSRIRGKVLIGLDDDAVTKLDDYEGTPFHVYERSPATAKLTDGTAIQVQIYLKGAKHFR